MQITKGHGVDHGKDVTYDVCKKRSLMKHTKSKHFSNLSIKVVFEKNIEWNF